MNIDAAKLQNARAKYIEMEWTLREIATVLELNYNALQLVARAEHWRAQRIEYLHQAAHGDLPGAFKPFRARIGQSCRFCHKPITRAQSYGEDGISAFHLFCMIPHADAPRVGIGNLRPAPAEAYQMVARLG
jgi:hypothetical protein